MTQLILKWTVVLLALFAAGPFAASIVSPLRLSDGSHAASLLTDGSTIQGLLAALAILAIASALGLISGRLIARDMGLTVAGLVLAWAAWRFSTVDRALARTGDTSMPTILALEGLLVCLAGTAIACAIAATSRERKPIAGILGEFTGEQPLGETLEPSRLAIAGVAGIAGAVAVVWLVANQATKGQCVMAAVLGGIACGAAAQLSATVNRIRLGILAPMLAMTLLAAAAPLIARAIEGSQLIAHATAGTLFPLGKLGPLDWLAGALLGVPVGLAWANSMIEKDPATAAA